MPFYNSAKWPEYDYYQWEGYTSETPVTEGSAELTQVAKDGTITKSTFGVDDVGSRSILLKAYSYK